MEDPNETPKIPTLFETYKKEPNKYKTIKISFKKIKLKKVKYKNLLSAIIRTNKATILVYQFIQLYFLHLDKLNEQFPIISVGFIKTCFKLFFNKAHAGPKLQEENLKLFMELEGFYKREFPNKDQLDGTNLSRILDYSAIDMLTNIENNVKQHFIKHLFKLVNCSFNEEHNKILDQIINISEKNVAKKDLLKKLKILKEDLIENTSLSEGIYLEWLNENKYNFLPRNPKMAHDICINYVPQEYLKFMIKINLKLEELECKQFHAMPLRNCIVPKYVLLDTKSLIHLIIPKNKRQYEKDIEGTKNNVWSMCFKMSLKIFRNTNYQFDYGIATDGFSVSIRFIHKSRAAEEERKKRNFKNAKERSKKENVGLDASQKKLLKEAKVDEAKLTKMKQMELYKEEQKKRRDDFMKLTKEEKKLFNENRKLISKAKKKKIEFPYFNELDKDDTDRLKNCNLVYCDPGKKNLYFMVDDNNNFFRYSNRTRLRETKRLKYQRLRENHKKKHTVRVVDPATKVVTEVQISQLETDLSKCNSKTCNFDKFKAYIIEKNKLNALLFLYYEDTYFRKLKWFSYLNTQRSESKLINQIKKKFEVPGKETVIIMGDWREFGRIKYISTPGIGLKRKLGGHIKIFSIDEFRTSCLNYKTETRCENLYINVENKKPLKKDKIEETPENKPEVKTFKSRKLHSVLLYKTANGSMGCINRDKNAVLNMRKIVQHQFLTNKRLENFKRGTASISKKKVVIKNVVEENVVNDLEKRTRAENIVEKQIIKKMAVKRAIFKKAVVKEIIVKKPSTRPTFKLKIL